MNNSHASNPLAGAVVGAIGGLLGSWMMVRFNHLVGRAGARMKIFELTVRAARIAPRT